jgi:hypothetical protein
VRRVASGQRTSLVYKEDNVSDVQITYDVDNTITGDIECVECPLDFIDMMKWPQAKDHLDVHREHGHTIRDNDLVTCDQMGKEYKRARGVRK